MIINKKNLEEIDKEVRLIPLTYDFMFKSVFEKNLEILKEFLIVLLHLEYELEELDIRILNNELPKENYREYQKRIDVNIVLNNNIFVEIEINREDFSLVKYRNKMYADKLSSMLLESGDNYKKLENIYFYQLNLNTENKSEDIGEHKIVSYDLTTNEVFIDNQQIILKYLEFYYRLYYNEPKKRTNDVIWLAALCAKNFTELYQMLKQVLLEKELNKFMKDVINMSLENFNLHEWQREKFDALLAQKKEELTIEKTTLTFIEEMLKNDTSYELISKVTHKSIEEIEEIHKNLK